MISFTLQRRDLLVWSNQNSFGGTLQTRYRPRFFVQVGHQTTYAYIGNKHFFSKSFHHQTYQNYEQSPQRLQNLYFQSNFSASKIKRIFLNFFFCEEYLTRRSTFISEMFWKLLIFTVLCFLKMCPIFVGSIHNFGKFNNDTI